MMLIFSRKSAGGFVLLKHMDKQKIGTIFIREGWFQYIKIVIIKGTTTMEDVENE